VTPPSRGCRSTPLIVPLVCMYNLPATSLAQSLDLFPSSPLAMTSALSSLRATSLLSRPARSAARRSRSTQPTRAKAKDSRHANQRGIDKLAGVVGVTLGQRGALPKLTTCSEVSFLAPCSSLRPPVLSALLFATKVDACDGRELPESVRSCRTDAPWLTQPQSRRLTLPRQSRNASWHALAIVRRP